MLIHVVLFNFKDDVSEIQKNDLLEKARTMLAPIPGVANLMAGKSIRDTEDQQYAISMNFKNEVELEAYRIHPEHERFRDEVFLPIIRSKQSLDYFDTTQ